MKTIMAYVWERDWAGPVWNVYRKIEDAVIKSEDNTRHPVDSLALLPCKNAIANNS